MYQIIQAPPGTKICDTIYPITPHVAGKLAADGFKGILRYTEVVTIEDLSACTGAGLGVFFATFGLSSSALLRLAHVLLEWPTYVSGGPLFALEGSYRTAFAEGMSLLGTTPDAALGTSMATSATTKLRALGVPAGATIFSDVEGGPHLPTDWASYCNAHAGVVHAAGDVPGGYFGFGSALTSHEMYAMAMTRYGHGASRLQDRFGQIAEPACGFCWEQGRPLDILHSSGIRIDVGALWEDFRGRRVSLVVAV